MQKWETIDVWGYLDIVWDSKVMFPYTGFIKQDAESTDSVHKTMCYPTIYESLNSYVVFDVSIISTHNIYMCTLS